MKLDTVAEGADGQCPATRVQNICVRHVVRKFEPLSSHPIDYARFFLPLNNGEEKPRVQIHESFVWAEDVNVGRIL